MRRLLAVLPNFTRPTVHVAGTNGKGSTTAIVESILHAANFRTGRFNSPHYVDPWDCISVNKLPVTQDQYTSTRSRIESLDESNKVSASQFEILTATALMIFEDEKVDIAILECGMGGKSDATNAIPNEAVLVSALTSVDLDHQAFLGDTVEEIAAHKAHIARPGRPFVLGPQKRPSVIPAVEQVTEQRRANLVPARLARVRPWEEVVDGPKPVSDRSRLEAGTPPPGTPVLFDSEYAIKTILNLHGEHQLENLSTALTIIDTIRRGPPFSRITDENIADGVRSTQWPGRLSWTRVCTPDGPKTVLLDAAHNPAGAAALRIYLDTVWKNLRTFLISLSHSPPKTALSTLKPLLRPGDRVAVLSFSAVEGMPWVKPTKVEDLVEASVQLVGPNGEVFPASNFAEAIRWASEKDSLLVIAGSIYLLSDFERFQRNI
ncbi:FolC bifunctional protein [Dacryopinax primogenitus]|uniref:FolC bifunctional protein n=1 Tax=Dacryopinax primogenitus (strain DJM 731) TaxID=1858805 RepID=M5FNB7_DACPD|nr:FolC bifunctional protein [Dacryopinax primogenitus]EJT97165.1 FolC bifunctional protein [Dacryopinax primogenitus]